LILLNVDVNDSSSILQMFKNSFPHAPEMTLSEVEMRKKTSRRTWKPQLTLKM